MTPPVEPAVAETPATETARSGDWPAWVPPAVIALIVALGAAVWWWRRRSNALLALPEPDYEEVPVEPAPIAPRPKAPVQRKDIQRKETPVAPVVPPVAAAPTARSTPPADITPADITPAPTPEPQTTETVADAAPAVSAPKTTRVRGGRRADVDVALEPLNASTTLINLRMRYALTLRNNGPIDATDVTVRMGIFAGQQASEQGVGGWLSMEGQPVDMTVESIPAGEEFRIEQEVAIPLNALAPIEIDGRRMAIALMAVDTRYNHPKGEQLLMGQTGKAFVVGREPPATPGTIGKLAPFRIDQGPTSFAPLGARDTGISRRA